MINQPISIIRLDCELVEVYMGETGQYVIIA